MICDRCSGPLFKADVLSGASVCTSCEIRLCGKPDEWSLFVAALKSSVRSDGTVHVNDVRPKVRGRIAHKKIGLYWTKAQQKRLIRWENGWEQSTDAVGSNQDKLARVYVWTSAA
ncbi:hypothetical protein GCM10011584_09780 [Nocardioides phosphati]|uniref:Uncharacterized protein n=1 Tax=Nocardioides phosphati TaxID=1867775 RepID=A0ABQ2N719_9ACTN|nr:hypothetical protein [Nocardioides phosphati]GGO86735.1 hypothetical protein GCM10011584_09780 [Nocardioides phosphati]